MAFDAEILELPKIIKTLVNHAQTDYGKSAVRRLAPSADESFLRSSFSELAEAYRYVKDDRTPSFGGIHVLGEALKRARIYAQIDVKDFINILSHIDAVRRMKREMYRYPESIDEAFAICDYADALVDLKELKAAIDHVIDPRGNIRDDASTELSKIRSRLHITERRIKESLDAILNREKDRLTEKIITERYERYVVPVKISEKNNVRGTILDYSSSGETAYIEPESVRNLSSEKVRLQAEEKREIERILLELSARVAENRGELENNIKQFTHLDLLFAKARHGYAIEGAIPEIGDRIVLIKARHPLIPKDEVVANTISFDDDKKMMVITGSNTGGKTVTLKTLGLLTLMAQTGLMIPAITGSEVRLFKSVRADIGDEQSIEQSLSTFSSHMSRIVDIVGNYDDDQLILLDELGSGTDPKEGAALAMSILNHLSDKESIVVATTHYPELKAYAYTRDFIMNASVEFDEKTLKPTYRLLLRTPGESHAFLISSRLGLDQTIIDDAKTTTLTEKDEVSSLIEKLKTESMKLDRELTRYERLNKELESAKKEALSLKRDLQKKKETIKDQVMREHAAEMNRLKDEAHQLIDELKTMREQSFKAHELAEKKHEIRSLQKEEEQTSKTVGHTYKPGERVYLLKYNRYGELVKKQKDDKWLINMGNLSSVFSEDEFEYAGESAPEKKEEKQTTTAIRKSVSERLDLRGMRVHEAKEELEKYLDDCALSKQPFATIIHGYGTLALRKMVKEIVDRHPLVKRHRDGESGEGGSGATVVYFE